MQSYGMQNGRLRKMIFDAMSSPTWSQCIITYMHSENLICIHHFSMSPPVIHIHVCMCQMDMGGPNLPFSTVSLYGLI